MKAVVLNRGGGSALNLWEREKEQISVFAQFGTGILLKMPLKQSYEETSGPSWRTLALDQF